MDDASTGTEISTIPTVTSKPPGPKGLGLNRPDRLPPELTSARERPGELDWDAFCARYFPGRRRHDFEALTAYGAYKGWGKAPHSGRLPTSQSGTSREPVRPREAANPEKKAPAADALLAAVQTREEEGGSST
jgi:hypothetical protein